jgi:hypothetical protein
VPAGSVRLVLFRGQKCLAVGTERPRTERDAAAGSAAARSAAARSETPPRGASRASAGVAG